MISIVLLSLGIICFLFVAVNMAIEVSNNPPNTDRKYYDYYQRGTVISVNEYRIPFLVSIIAIPVGTAGLIFRIF